MCKLAVPGAEALEVKVAQSGTPQTRVAIIERVSRET